MYCLSYLLMSWSFYSTFCISISEPNLLSHTTHSISRKGVRKRDMNDGELREILADILPFVRSGHVIPTHGDVFTSAVKRGLVCSPAPFAVYDAPHIHLSPASAWVRTRNMALYTRPRFFLPYYQEAKVTLLYCSVWFRILQLNSKEWQYV